MRVTSTITSVFDAQAGMYFFGDPWSGGELPDDAEGDSGFRRAARKGFLGMTSPWSGVILTGTRYGAVSLTLDVQDAPVPAQSIDEAWGEVVEAPTAPARACVVRSKADTESGGIRTSVPDETGQSFRLIPDT